MRKSSCIYYLICAFIIGITTKKVSGQATSPSDYFRSFKTGTWNAAGSWESSTDGLNNWVPSSLVPTSNANTITIRNGHSITMNNSNTIDQVVIAKGGILDIATTSSTLLTIADGSGNDIIVQSGGTFKHNLAANGVLPKFNGSATLEIQAGGILEAANNNGIPSNYAATNSAIALNVLWADGSIFNWNNTGSPLSAVSYFPALPAIPVFRFTKAASVGGTDTTFINGLTEANADVSFSSSGVKVFRNGLTGTGKISVTSTSSGKFVITGMTATLGGSGRLELGDKGLLVNNGTTLKLTSNKIISNYKTSVSTITYAGILLADDYIINGSSKIQIDGTVKTTNINGLSGGSNTTFSTDSGSVVNAPGASSVIDYNRLGNQSVTTAIAYKNLIISGSGIKTAATGADILVSGTLNILSGNTFALNGVNDLKLNGGGILNINSNAVFNNGGESAISGGGTPAINIYGTFITKDAQGFTGLNTSIPGITPKIYSGSTIEYGKEGDQDVTARDDYKNITFSGSGVKNISTCNPAGIVTIKNNVTADASNKTFGDSTTSLTMTGGRFKVGGTGTKPDISGAYNLTGGTIEFSNSGSTKETIRSPLTYFNIEVSGTNVFNSSGITSVADGGSFAVKTGGVFENSGLRLDGTTGSQTFIMEPGAAFRTGVTGGFSGNDSAAVRNFETISINPRSTIEYSRKGDQTITPLANYPSLLLKGSGNKVAAGGSIIISANADSVVIDTTVVFKISSGAKVDFQNRHVIVHSNAANSGIIGEIADVTSALLNATNVTVERFIPAKRSFRFLSSPVTTVSTIKQNWMEDTVNTSVYTISDPHHGYGTNITGSNPTVNGFDPTKTNNSSFFKFITATQKWTPVTDTKGTLSAGDAYRLLVRGDRSTDMTKDNNNPASANTILRTTGTLFSGTYTPALSANNKGYTLIGNPYASPVDFQKMYANANNISSSYYVWDPTLNKRGVYVAYNAIYDTSNNKSSFINKNIQSGQAFFVQTTGSSPVIQFKESYKSVSNARVFRNPFHKTKLSVQLFLNNNTAMESNADGLVAFFDDDFTTAIGNEDSYKFTNLDENIAIERNDTLLSMEGRPSITADDTIPLKIWQPRQQSYYLKLTANNFSAGITSFIKDNYLQKETSIDLSSETLLSVNIDTTVPASYINRFSIVFKTGNVLSDVSVHIKAYQKDEGISVNWISTAETNIRQYEVEKSLDGIHFNLMEIVPAKNNGVSEMYNFLDLTTIAGSNFYRIKIKEKTGKIKYTEVINVKVTKNSKDIIISPNPVKGNIVSLQFNNIEKGKYIIAVYNIAGQKVYNGTAEHISFNDTYELILLKTTPKGVYNIVLNKKDVYTTKALILK